MQPDRESSRGCTRRGGFTLIELLVVIAIIAIIAGMIVGISGISVSKRRIAATQGGLHKLETALQNYHATLGFYPACPLHGHRPGGGNRHRMPPDNPTGGLNTLYYELTGTWYRQQGNDLIYHSSRGGEGITSTRLRRHFNTDGIQNKAPDPSGARSFIELGKRDYVSLRDDSEINVLVAPVTWPAAAVPGTDRNGLQLENYRPFLNATDAPRLRTVNPWQYRSGPHAQYNRTTFDLWAVVPAGGKLYRIDNWSREPKVLNQ